MRSWQAGRCKGTGWGEGREPSGSKRTNRRLGPCLLAALMLALGMLAILPAAASAGPSRYVFEMCDSALPGGGVNGVRYAQSAGPWAPIDNCEQPGGSLSIRQVGKITSGGGATWSLPIEPPPGGTMESTAVSAAYCGGPENNAYIFHPGWPLDACAEENRVFHLGENFRGFDIEFACYSECSEGAWVYAHYFATVEVDPVAPTLTKVEGSLLSGNVIRGYQSISADAHDVGGGVANVSISVNGLPAAQSKVSNCDVAQAHNVSAEGTVAAAITPCPTAYSANWTLDTEAYPFHGGVNTVQICASDFSTLDDPNTTCSAVKSVNVDNSCAESQVGGGEVLSAQFAESRNETVTVPYGKGAEVAGQLSNNAGDPVPGATLCVKMQTLGVEPGAFPVGTVKTDANGDYAYRVPPGPDRNIVIGYRHDTYQVARAVRFYSTAEPSLQLAPRRLKNHQRVRFWGQVPGPSGGGRVIVMQANVPGSRQWITFRKATTDAQGDFQSAYRFSSTTRTTTYRFRAVVPDQAGYPWVEGASRPARVLVRG